jgi:LemA protein
MSTGLLTLIVIGGLGLAAVLIYNRLISLRNRYLNGFSQIEVQLQRRYELIPNLVDTARAYMKHERETLLEVTRARDTAAACCKAAAQNPKDPSLMGQLASADNLLTRAMGGLNVVMENYPELKADAQMRDLTEELAHTENRVAYARQAYSDAVMDYNIAREQFPAVLIAGVCNFTQAQLFEAEDPNMKLGVKVSFA